MVRKRASKITDMNGLSTGLLSVVSDSLKNDKFGCRLWNCICQCGESCTVSSGYLKKNRNPNCGCIADENRRAVNRTHGKHGSRVYRIWVGMKTRCCNESSKDFPRYGGRGVTVCKRWMSFSLFYKDMGDPPSDEHTIERSNNNSGYCKSNCEWAHYTEQAKNRVSSVKVVYKNQELCAAEVDRILGFNPGTVAKRIRKGFEDPFAPINPAFSRKQKHSDE